MAISSGINVSFRTKIVERLWCSWEILQKRGNSLEVGRNVSDLLLVSIRTHSIKGNCFQINYQTDKTNFFQNITVRMNTK